MRWHHRGIYINEAGTYSADEQFWGRAVRASYDSQEPRDAFYFLEEQGSTSANVTLAVTLRRSQSLLPQLRSRLRWLVFPKSVGQKKSGVQLSFQ